MNTIMMEDLIEVGDICTNLPWGMGHEEFEGNSEAGVPYTRFFVWHYYQISIKHHISKKNIKKGKIRS